MRPVARATGIPFEDGEDSLELHAGQRASAHGASRATGALARGRRALRRACSLSLDARPPATPLRGA